MMDENQFDHLVQWHASPDHGCAREPESIEISCLRPVPRQAGRGPVGLHRLAVQWRRPDSQPERRLPTAPDDGLSPCPPIGGAATFRLERRLESDREVNPGGGPQCCTRSTPCESMPPSHPEQESYDSSLWFGRRLPELT